MGFISHIYFYMHECYWEGTHFDVLNVLLSDYFERRGDDGYINIIGHWYVGAVSMNSQPLFWDNML